MLDTEGVREDDMVTTPDRAVMRWLFTFSGVVALLIVFGGFVRLTRSGLSIVQWDPVTGVVPPIGHRAWTEAFAAYRRSPEFIKVNASMTLGEFQRIYTIEWVHRLIARLAGFAFAVPFFVFLARKRIPRRDLAPYLVMGSLFVLQAVAGWLMVASGLKDRPSVSHINLSVHLLLAFTLLGVAAWTALGHRCWPDLPRRRAPWSAASKLAAAFIAALLVQIAYGGLTAGLKAGHVSDTWPKMLGAFVPDTAFESISGLVESPITVMFVHRWFAFLVATLAVAVAVVVLRQPTSTEARRGVIVLVALVGAQIVLGIATVLTSVDELLALGHQANAIGLFGVGVFVAHRVRALDSARLVDDATEAWDSKASQEAFMATRLHEALDAVGLGNPTRITETETVNFQRFK
ncbi:MAG: COX15/CtaA family protein [Actinobacteria bacterium]|nr:COX15/CtaA family protein [Actinomycetota bacterium]